MVDHYGSTHRIHVTLCKDEDRQFPSVRSALTFDQGTSESKRFGHVTFIKAVGSVDLSSSFVGVSIAKSVLMIVLMRIAKSVMPPLKHDECDMKVSSLDRHMVTEIIVERLWRFYANGGAIRKRSDFLPMAMYKGEPLASTFENRAL
jgi:hypothetical protein